MVQQSFHDRIARIEQKGGRLEMLSGPAEIDGPRGGKSGKVATAGKAPNAPGFLKILMIGMLMVPVGMAIGLMTKLFLDPDITPEAAHYIPLLVMVAGGHVLLFGGVATAVMARLRRKALNLMIFAGFTGYGISSALLNYAIQ